MAIVYYEKVIKNSPHNEEVEKYILSNYGKLTLSLLKSEKLNSFDAYVDAHTNLAVMYLCKDNVDLAVLTCKKAIDLNPYNF
jgi:tetratricopeptide (TPR) repeat protein